MLDSFFAGKGVETLYVDAKADFEKGELLQCRARACGAPGGRMLSSSQWCRSERALTWEQCEQ